MAFAIDVTANVKAFRRQVEAIHRDQIPFAAARALTATARKVAEAERAGLPSTFDRPTPFTLNAFAVTPARKNTLVARVFAKDIQARYLAPYIDGGQQVLRANAILQPVDILLNAYGNIPRGKLQQLKGRPDIFIGSRKTKAGSYIGGVWKRTVPPKIGRHRGHVTPRGRIQLLIRFGDPREVRQRLPFEARARQVVDRELGPAMGTALTEAIQSAR